MSDIDVVRDEKRTEDDKMEIIADFMEANDNAANVVKITNMSGTLSDEDYKKVDGEGCVIVASTQYFYKQYSASTLIRYGAVPRLGVDKVIFDYIDITRDTKAYELKNEAFPAS